uniref:Alpha-macroglobulin receptor-binding domain-containing protein n=1 Tax=Oryzias latipes TaxID=8090 RepID=A0A3B3HRD8_ORYLA
MFLIPSSGYRTYLVTVSSHLTAGNKEILCALIKTPTEPASLTITLDVDSSSTKIGQLSFKTEIYLPCFKCLLVLQVPIVSSTTVASISVKIQGKMDSLYQETKVLIEPPAFVHIVQTEKPIYKPGQTVQFRIVSMDTNFIPVNRMVRFYIHVLKQDPNSNRIAQWMDKSIDGGILDLSHSTIPEAAQGIYVITAETDKGETVSHNFEIKEYVLPKFEVTVNLPTVITILDDEVTLKICGKYTYGKPVLGSVRAEFCRRSNQFSWLPSPKQKDICKTFELSTDKSGCATQNVALAGFAINTYKYFDSFEVTAELEEFGTGMLWHTWVFASFTTQIRTVSFEDLPSSYKPGLPLEGKVIITLAKYATATFSPEGSTTVTVTSVGGLNKRFTVNKDNRLLYQEEKLTQIPGEYTIKAEGQSCVLAQVQTSRNQSQSWKSMCSENVLLMFTLFVEVKVLLGLIPTDQLFLFGLTTCVLFRVDVEEGYINIYLDGLKKGQKETFNVILEEDQQVGNLKPAVVKVYDYYQTSDEAVTDYTSPCNK